MMKKADICQKAEDSHSEIYNGLGTSGITVLK